MSDLLLIAGLAVFLAVVATLHPGGAVVLAIAMRLYTDTLGNEVSASQGTIVATALGAWACAVAVGVVVVRRQPARLGWPGLLLAALVAWMYWRGQGLPWTGEVWREVGQWLSVTATFVAGSVVFASVERLRLLARMIAVLAVGQVAYGMYQLAFGLGLATGGFQRAFGTFPHPSWLAFFLVLAVTVLPLTGFTRPARIALGAIFLLGIVLTFSRGPMVFLFAWVLAYAFASRRFQIALTGTATAVMLLLVPAVRSRFVSEYSDGRLEGSYLSRSLLRELAISQWLDSPWVGQGTAAFFADISPRSFVGAHIEAHSDIFKLLVDQGVVGLGLYLAALAAILVTVRRVDEPWMPAVAATLMTLPVMGILDVYYRQNTTMTFLWLLLGGCWGLAMQRRDSAQVAGDGLGATAAAVKEGAR